MLNIIKFILYLQNVNIRQQKQNNPAMKPLLFTAALMLAIQVTLAIEPERPKPVNVLMIGNSQCPLIINNQLIENLAESNKGGPLIKITGCIKGGATSRAAQHQGLRSVPSRSWMAGLSRSGIEVS